VIHEFLLANTLQQLVNLLAQRQGLFKPVGRVSDGVRVLDAFDSLHEPLTTAVLDPLSEVAPRCGMTPPDSHGVELRVWSRINDYLEPTHDATVDDRALGFVLFLHREPRAFEGGSLHLHTPMGESIIEPSQNSMIFFSNSVATRAGAVRPASRALIDSRLTLEGWIHTCPVPATENDVRSRYAIVDAHGTGEILP
jgi:hypothetical protein